MIRTRIAPSPTGHLHVGTARTALFNLLFARHNNGQFILRIEDTDKERSKKEFEKEIIDGLHWLGINWDEGPDVGGPYGPYRQSERGDIYAKYIKQLLGNDHAYYCFCTPEELETERAQAIAKKLPQIYSGKCSTRNAKSVIGVPDLSASTRADTNRNPANTINTNRSGGVIRFRIPEKIFSFDDAVRGRVSFDGNLLGDIAIAKDETHPFYNFAVVIDDHLMEISHMIRGEEHLGNTPKQIALYEALGWIPPVYAHAPLLLNSERAKLSKRDATTVGVDDYKQEGFLPEAIINFVALLGWHPSGNKEIMTREEMIELFSLERIQKAGAVFDIEKLEWLNSHYIKSSDTQILEHTFKTLYPEIANKTNNVELTKIIEASRERIKTIKDIGDQIKLFTNVSSYTKELLIWKDASIEATKNNLEKILGLLNALSDDRFTAKNLETTLAPLTTAQGNGPILWPLRVALSGERSSPGPYEIMNIIGKNETKNRINKAVELCSD